MTAHSALRRAALPSVRSLALAFALLGFALPAAAAIYHVGPSGDDASAGTSPGAAWRTLAKANAVLQPGDVCRIADGAYADGIHPANNGTAGARISYVGNLANPGAVSVSGIQLSKAFVSVKGVKATGSFHLDYVTETSKAWHDSVAWCIVPECTIWGAQDCMVARCEVNGQTALMNDRGYSRPGLDPAIASPARDTLRENAFHVDGITSKGFALRGDARSCVFENNRFHFVFHAATGGDVQGRYLYNSFHNVFRGNRWRVEADGPLPAGAQYVAFSLRDSSSFNSFERDTMECGLASGHLIGGRLVNSGNAGWEAACTGNRWIDCVYRTTGYTFSQDLLDGATLQNSVFASRDSWGLYLLEGVRNTTIRNCTIASWAGAAMKVEGDLRPGGNTISSNIFWSAAVGACYSGRAVVVHNHASGFSEDHNLFYAPRADAGVTAAEQAVYWGATACGGVGAGTAWAGTSGGADAHSVFGSPLFASADWATFDPRLGSGSAAIGLGEGGGDAGVHAGGSGPIAEGPTPVGAVNDLAVAQSSEDYALLTWTAPGPGTPAAYDLRLAAQPIDAGNFALAMPVLGVPAPLPGGREQSCAVTGLPPDRTAYFALRWRNAAGAWSPLSNVPSAGTTRKDQVRPSRITDLH